MTIGRLMSRLAMQGCGRPKVTGSALTRSVIRLRVRVMSKGVVMLYLQNLALRIHVLV